MQLGGIDTNLMVALRALLLERSVTRAAKALGLTQSSMSHALARLRTQFNDPLLVQTGRAMVLTERALALIGPVNEVVTALERVFADQTPFNPATSKRTFRILGTDNLELYILPQLAALIAREAPSISLRFHHLDKDWACALQNGDADLKLGRKYTVARGLRSGDLVVERLVCVVRKGHPVACDRITMNQYASLGHVAIAPTLGLAETFSSHVDEVLREHELKRRVAVSVSHFLVAPFVVASSNLVLTASERLAKTFERSLRLRFIELPFAVEEYQLTQVWAERSEGDAGHRWLRDAVLRSLAP